MKYLKGKLTLTLFALVIIASYQSAAQVQTPRYYTSMGNNTNGFYEYLPIGYSNSNQSFPLLIALHGVGERGNGSPMYLPVLLTYGPAGLINQGKFPATFNVNGQSFSFIVLTPQFYTWPSASDIDQVINYAIQHYKVDVNRIYLTGVSMGGGVIWDYTGGNANYAKRIAAVVPISGASYPDKTKANTIASSNLPVWALHNDGDPVVPYWYTTYYIKYINTSPTPPNPLARQTIFSSNEHDAWTKGYDPNYTENGLNVYQWMLLYSRNGSVANQPPVANAGTDQTITLPANSVTLNGSTSKDPDGTISSYNWVELSGPSQATFSSQAISNPLVSNLIAGTYQFKLTVTDNKNASSSDNIMVTVNPAPVVNPGTTHVEAENYSAYHSIMTQPTSDVGGGINVGGIGTGSWMDYSIMAPSTGTYNISLRIATPNTGVQLQILKQDGTVLTTMNIPATNGWQTWATVSSQIPLVSGIQTIRIYSLNGSWNFNWFEFSLSGASVSNIPPIVNAGTNQIITLPVNSVTLKGTASDPDGSIASTIWKQLSGPGTSAIASIGQLQTTASSLVQGIYTFQLTATDNKGASISSNVQVTVNAASTTPPPSACGRAIKIVVLGSSTAYGTGAIPIDSSWVNKYTSYLKTKNNQNIVVNLAEPGYTTYEVLRPTGSVPPANRPAPDTSHNITKALSLHPDAIIINLPNNDIGYGFTLSEIENNYETTISLAKNAGVLLWVTTTQPRTNLNTGERNNLMILRDWTYTRFGGHAIDFWTTVANADGSINSLYSYGDNIHVNNAGHQIFYTRAVGKYIPDTLCSGTSTPTSASSVGLTRYIKVQLYGGTGAYTNSQWNNWNIGTAAVNNINSGVLKYTDGTLSSINSIISYSKSVGDNGVNYATTISGTMAPAGVLRFASYADVSRTITINGLSTSKKYDVEFYASRYSTGNNAIFTFNGISDTIITYDNYFNKARFRNIIPNAQGQIMVSISKTNVYSYLNGFMLTEQGTDYQPFSVNLNGQLNSITQEMRSLEVYPNPFSNKITLNIHNSFAGPYTLQIIDVNGRIKKLYNLIKNPGQDAQPEISTTDLEKGTYFIKVNMGSDMEVKKIIRN